MSSEPAGCVESCHERALSCVQSQLDVWIVFMRLHYHQFRTSPEKKLRCVGNVKPCQPCISNVQSAMLLGVMVL